VLQIVGEGPGGSSSAPAQLPIANTPSFRTAIGAGELNVFKACARCKDVLL
jgi:hypothetical protein